MIDALLFDLGGVLVHLHPEAALDRFSRALPHLGPERVRARMDEATPLCQAYERGVMGTYTFLRDFAAHFETDMAWNQLTVCWQDIFSPNWPVIQLLDQLSRRYTCHLLSNTNALHMTHLYQRFDFFSHFATQTLSYEVGLLKPEPAIYRLAARHAGVDEARCLFIDDREENVLGAREAGMRAVRYTDPEALETALRQYNLNWELTDARAVL